MTGVPTFLFRSKPGKTPGKGKTPTEENPDKEKEALLARLSEAENLLKKVKGIDPDEYKRLVEKEREAEEARIAAEREAEEARARATGDFEKIRQSMEKSHREALEKVTGELNQSREAIKKMTVKSAFSSSNYVGSKINLTPAKSKMIYGGHFDVNDQGQLVAYDQTSG